MSGRSGRALTAVLPALWTELSARRFVLAGDAVLARAQLSNAPPAVLAQRNLAKRFVELTEESARRQPATLLEETSDVLQSAERRLGSTPSDAIAAARRTLTELVAREQSRAATRSIITPRRRAIAEAATAVFVRLVMSDALTLLLMLGAAAHAAAQPSAPSPLENTTWQLVKFQSGRGPAITPDDPAKYVVQFGRGGEVTVRIDCNRGRGKWTLLAGNRLQLGPLALTRAKCPYGSLHDTVVKHWTDVHSLTLKDGHLVLSLRDRTGTYEFAPAPAGRR